MATISGVDVMPFRLSGKAGPPGVAVITFGVTSCVSRMRVGSLVAAGVHVGTAACVNWPCAMSVAYWKAACVAVDAMFVGSIVGVAVMVGV